MVLTALFVFLVPAVANAVPVEVIASGLVVQFDGTGYGTSNQCALEPTATAQSGPTDGNVCTNDNVAFRWELVVPATSSPDIIVLSQTLPAGWTWAASTAPICAGSAALGYTGTRVLSGDGRSVSCQIQVAANTGVTMQLVMEARPGPSATPDTDYLAELTVNNGTEAVAVPADRAVKVVSGPQVDARKSIPAGGQSGFVSLGYATFSGVEYFFRTYLIRLAGSGVKGEQPVALPYTFYDDYSAFPDETIAEVLNCGWGASCVVDAPNKRIAITVNSGTGFIEGATRYLAVRMYVPTSLAGTYTNSLTSFEPVGVFGAPNVEPDVTNNSQRQPFLGTQPTANTGANGQKWTVDTCANPADLAAIGGPCQLWPFSRGTYISVPAGGAFWSKIAVYSGLADGAGQPILDPVVCDYWDPAVYQLDSERAIFVTQGDGSPYADDQYVLEYSDAAWPDPQSVDAHASTSCSSNPDSWHSDPADLAGPISAVRAQYIGSGGQLGSIGDTAQQFFQLGLPMTVSEGTSPGLWYNIGKIAFVDPTTDQTQGVTSRQYARVAAYELAITKTSNPPTLASTGSVVTYTLSPSASIQDATAEVNGLLVRDEIDDCLSGVTVDPATLAWWSATIVQSADPGQDGLYCTRDSGETTTIVEFTPREEVGPLTTSSVIPPITYRATLALTAPPDLQVHNTATVSTTDPDIAPASVSKVLSVTQIQVAAIQKLTSRTLLEVTDTDMTWDVAMVNALTQGFGRSQWIDVLPHMDDGRGSTVRQELTGPVLLFGDLADGVVEYTTDPDPSPDVLANTSAWTSTPPASWASVTALRITTNNYFSGFYGRAEIPAASPDAVGGENLANSIGGYGSLAATPVSLSTASASTRVIASAVGDRVWSDANADGTQDPEEPGLSGVTLRLYDTNGVLLATTTTDATGLYQFSGLPSGQYSVEVDLGTVPVGYTRATYDLAGGSAAATGRSGLFDLSADTARDDVDFGFAAPTTAPLTITKEVQDAGAGWFGEAQTFTLEVTCSSPSLTDPTVSVPDPGFPQTIEAQGSSSQMLQAPVGSTCTVTEPDSGGATSTQIQPDAVLISDEGPTATITVTNTFAEGQIAILKSLTGAGAANFGTGPFTFAVSCSYNGQQTHDSTLTLAPAIAGAPTQSEPITGIPLGSACTITETDAGGADAPAPPASVLADDPDEPVTVELINHISAGQVDVTKVLVGDLADTPVALDTTFHVKVTCQQQVGDGPRLTLHSSELAIQGGQTLPLLDAAGARVLLPVEARCFIEETDRGEATDAQVSHGSFDSAAIVTPTSTDSPTTLHLTATNTFSSTPLPGAGADGSPGSRPAGSDPRPSTDGALAAAGTRVAVWALLAAGVIVPGVILFKRSHTMHKNLLSRGK